MTCVAAVTTRQRSKLLTQRLEYICRQKNARHVRRLPETKTESSIPRLPRGSAAASHPLADIRHRRNRPVKVPASAAAPLATSRTSLLLLLLSCATAAGAISRIPLGPKAGSPAVLGCDPEQQLVLQPYEPCFPLHAAVAVFSCLKCRGWTQTGMR